MRDLTSKHGTLGDFDPAGSGTDLTDAAMAKWERAQDGRDAKLPREFVHAVGNIASDEGLTIELITEDGPEDAFGDASDRIDKSVTIYTMPSTKEVAGKDYNTSIGITQMHSYGAHVLAYCASPDDVATIERVCRESIKAFSPNASGMAATLVVRLNEVGLPSTIFK